jgi:hypothetical protein
VTLVVSAVPRRSFGQIAIGIVVGSLTGVLAFLAALEVTLALPMLMYPGELMYGEAILYGHAHRLLDGVPLYQAIDRLPYSVAGYTPLFYVLAASLQSFVGPGFASGRGLGLVCLAFASVLVGVLAAGEGRGVRVAFLAALVFLAVGVPGSGPLPWTALYKEDSLALTLTLGGFVLVRSGRGLARMVVVAGFLSALAILTKQTYAPMALAPAVWLWRRDRRLCLAFLAATVLPVGGVSLALQWSTGEFLNNVVVANVNPASGDWLSRTSCYSCCSNWGRCSRLASIGPVRIDAGLKPTACWWGPGLARACS